MTGDKKMYGSQCPFLTDSWGFGGRWQNSTGVQAWGGIREPSPVIQGSQPSGRNTGENCKRTSSVLGDWFLLVLPWHVGYLRFLHWRILQSEICWWFGTISEQALFMDGLRYITQSGSFPSFESLFELFFFAGQRTRLILAYYTEAWLAFGKPTLAGYALVS